MWRIELSGQRPGSRVYPGRRLRRLLRYRLTPVSTGETVPVSVDANTTGSRSRSITDLIQVPVKQIELFFKRIKEHLKRRARLHGPARKDAVRGNCGVAT